MENNNNRFGQQFLFTKETNIPLNWACVNIANFSLYYHPDLPFTKSVCPKRTLYMLGSLYDWVEPSLSNQQLLDKIAGIEDFNSFITQLSSYLGEYILIFQEDEKFYLFNDATGQQEIYYDSKYTTFGSTTKLLSEIIHTSPHTDQDMINLYSSNVFKKNKLFVSDTTHLKNVFHLLPNNLIDLNNKVVKRFFPFEKLSKQPVNIAAEKAANMLKGYMKALAIRKKLAIPFTGGIDSRVLFFASLEEDAIYYIYKYSYMTDNYHDIATPKLITTAQNKPFEIIPLTDEYENLDDSFHFPDKILKPTKYFYDRIYLNGNISELGRALYGTIKNIKASDLAIIKGYKASRPAIKLYEEWLKNSEIFVKNGYHVLDMFNWEQSTSILVAKVMAEDNAIGLDTISPFNSRELLSLLLSADRKYRDYYDNKLHRAILLALHPKALSYPLNNYLSFKIRRLLSKMRIFNSLRYFYKFFIMKNAT